MADQDSIAAPSESLKEDFCVYGLMRGVYNFDPLSTASLTLARLAQETSTSRPISGQSDHDVTRPKLHLLGMKRSGKSSISKVVFHSENASDTLYIESTSKLIKEPKKSFMDFDVYDYPANLDINDPDTSPKTIFASPGALIWVIDAQDEYFESIDRLIGTLYSFAQILGPEPSATAAPGSNTQNLSRLPPHMTLNVFVHKTDGLSDDFKGDIFRDIQARIIEDLIDVGLEDWSTSAAFHQTSIYDHSIFEAISKVLQKLIPSTKHATMESLINSLCSNCRIEKAYLFDIQWRIYMASDTSPGDMRSFETCSDYVDMVRDLSQIYGWRPPSSGEGQEKYDDFHTESLCTMERPGFHYLFMKAMNKYLSLVCIMGEDSPAENQPLIEKNMRVFQKALAEVLDR